MIEDVDIRICFQNPEYEPSYQYRLKSLHQIFRDIRYQRPEDETNFCDEYDETDEKGEKDSQAHIHLKF